MSPLRYASVDMTNKKPRSGGVVGGKPFANALKTYHLPLRVLLLPEGYSLYTNIKRAESPAQISPRHRLGLRMAIPNLRPTGAAKS